jgi:hypothetical protein
MKYMLHHFRDENLKVIDDLWSATIYDREQYYSATIYDREQYTLEIISFNLQNLKLEGESDSIHGRDSGKGYLLLHGLKTCQAPIAISTDHLASQLDGRLP